MNKVYNLGTIIFSDTGLTSPELWIKQKRRERGFFVLMRYASYFTSNLDRFTGIIGAIMLIIIGVYTVYRLLCTQNTCLISLNLKSVIILVINWSLNLFVSSPTDYAVCVQWCDKKNAGLGLFQYRLVQWWACSDWWDGMALVSGQQLFNLWRIISWRRHLLVAVGGGESNRCSTKRYLFIHLVAVVALTAGKKRILFVHYNALCNIILDCKLHIVGLVIKTNFLCELCGFWNIKEYWVSLSQAPYILDLSSNPPPTHTAMCVGMECQAGGLMYCRMLLCK